MRDALIDDHLQAIVEGNGAIGLLVYMIDVRDLSGVLPDFGRGIGGARGGKSRQVDACGARDRTRRSTVLAGPANTKRRLVQVTIVCFPVPVIADVSNVHGQVVADGALEVQTPLSGMSLMEVGVHRISGAGRSVSYACHVAGSPCVCHAIHDLGERVYGEDGSTRWSRSHRCGWSRWRLCHGNRSPSRLQRGG